MTPQRSDHADPSADSGRAGRPASEASDDPLAHPVARHYTHGGLMAAILAQLDAAGLVLNRLTPQDLAPLDHLHGRGEAATKDIIERLMTDRKAAAADGRTPADRADLNGRHLVDIGCGVGGPARYIAQRTGARITGIDLTAEFIEVARRLTELTGQARRVAFVRGNALNLPFAAGRFDGGYTHNVSMSVPDKARFYREAARVLRPGARFVAAEVASGPGGPVIFPVPWAMTAEISHLITAEETARLLEVAGFRIEAAEQSTEVALAHNAQARARLERDGPPVLSPTVILGERALERARNSARNLEQARILPIEFTCIRA